MRQKHTHGERDTLGDIQTEQHLVNRKEELLTEGEESGDGRVEGLSAIEDGR